MELETPYIHLRMEDKLLVGTYTYGLKIDLAIAKEIVRSRRAFTRDRELPALIISRGLVSIEKPAREYLASAAAITGLRAAAIVVDSAFGMVLGTLFRKVNQAGMPVRVFTDEAKARKWLEQFVK